tara:strand:- start:3290 stop:4348 length:1059 start_codon:yes stop_codon:yes gene_type:complete
VPDDFQSGKTVSTDSINEHQADLASHLNGSVVESDLSMAAIGSDQLYSGALRSSAQQEVLDGTVVTKHIAYPETIHSPDWNDPINFHSDSTGIVGSVLAKQGFENAFHRQRWQNIEPYNSAGTIPTDGAPYFPAHIYSPKMYRLNPGKEGCSVFFYLNARLSTMYTRLNKKALVAGAANAGSRGWVAPVFFFKQNKDAPLLRFSPSTGLGGFACEFNGTAKANRRFNDVEHIYSVTETMYISRWSLENLAFYCGFSNPDMSVFNMGPDDPFDPYFAWALKGGRDSFDHRWAAGSPIDMDLMALPASDKNDNGQAFKVGNGNVGYMAFDYIPMDGNNPDYTEQAAWIFEEWGT